MTAINNIFRIILMLCLLCYIDSRRPKNRRKKIVIDTDPGGDDALAVVLALGCEIKTRDIEIVAITVTYGNTCLKNAEKNLLKILTAVDRKVPVFAGAEKPLINNYEEDYFFGNDGFGDFNFTQRITTKINRSKHASVALIDLVRQYPGEITLITLGPLTTVATAIAIEPNFLHLIDQHIIMGAGINTTDAEFNFKQDPESDWIALTNVNKLSIILPIDTVVSHVFPEDKYKSLFSKLNFSSFLQKAERKAIEKQNNTWLPADGITIAIALEPSIITQSFETNITPVLEGDARGSVVVNSSLVHNARIIESFDKDAFERLLLTCLS